MTAAAPYSIPQDPGRWRAIALAALMHAALLAFLWIGVRWQNETPVVVEAEVWDMQTRTAAPLPVPVAAPEPEPEPAPKPVVKTEPKPAIEETAAKPDIALEQEKKRKAHEKKQHEEEQLAKQKAAQERQAKLKKEQEEQQAKQRKAEEERLAKIEAEKRLEKEKADKAKKLAEAKRKQQDADDKVLAKIRAEEMQRITGGVTGAGSSGDAPKSTGNNRSDPSYGDKIRGKIKSNTVFATPDSLSGNPAVEYLVELLPDGSLRGTPRKRKSSGIPGFDEAVLRAIEKSAPFPADKTGTVPSSLVVSHKPKD